ncbi:MAG: hypothetical protein DI623_00370 [Sphingomonas sanxanigenens]|uniref:Poly(3-hydroxyalkanoate) polymerase subunit PhaE n=1 Tax=Sphingomonas sanxanigenens TaxID=397260 RepID=A0A2W5AGN0_9SPHN|nr:MAG: hypothetical protein DI623_00370 [Sphingomonas sanxanigenens]
MSKDGPDPATFFREMLGQWETIASEFGSGLLKSGEFARTVNTAATAKARAMSSEVVSRALAAANMPSREEIGSLSERMQAVEDRLARIEALLTEGAAPPKPRKDKAKRAKAPAKKG